MKIYDLTKLSTRMFKARTSRTILTILGMGVGISAILFLVGLGYGIQRTLLETITTTDSLLSLDIYPSNVEKKIEAADLEQVQSISGIEEISPVLETIAQVKYQDVNFDTKALVVDEKFLNFNGTKIEGGTTVRNTSPQGVVISSTFSKIFGKESVELLGEEITLTLSAGSEEIAKENDNVVNRSLEKSYSQTFKVIGIADVKENTIYLNKIGVTDIPLASHFTKLKVKCSSSDVMAGVREELGARGFLVSALTDVVDQVNKVFAVVRVILALFGMIALLVSAIGMFNTMTVALLERTEEIGIMKSIGASDYDILWMFVFESTIMGFLGGITGIILGIVGGFIFNLLVNFLASQLGGIPVSLFYFPAWFLAFILFSATVVGFLTGLVPARKASSTDPLNALRYK